MFHRLRDHFLRYRLVNRTNIQLLNNKFYNSFSHESDLRLAVGKNQNCSLHSAPQKLASQ
jgi:hypothetical protein